MEGHSFDLLTQTATAGLSRRGSLATLGAAGLAALLAAPYSAQARKGSKKKKRQNLPPAPVPQCPDCPDLCAPQVEECTNLVKILCEDPAGCQGFIDCCSLLGTC